MSVLLEFAMFPTDQGESVSSFVSPLIEMIRDSGISYQLTPMGTIIETETLTAALKIVEDANQVLQQLGCNRVYSSLKLDIRNGPMGRLQSKVEAIRQNIGEVNA